MRHFSSCPHSSLAILAEKSSDNARKIFVRKVCSKVRHVSPGRVVFNELMLCVATIGMHLACLERVKNFSSPLGSFSPTVAKCWHSSHTKTTGRHTLFGSAEMWGMRFKTARWKSILSITPMARANPGFILTGKFSATILPCSSRVAIGGRGFRPDTSVSPFRYSSTGGQKVFFTRGLSSNKERKTEMPSTMELCSFLSRFFQSPLYQRLTESSCSFLSGSMAP